MLGGNHGKWGRAEVDMTENCHRKGFCKVLNKTPGEHTPLPNLDYIFRACVHLGFPTLFNSVRP